MLRAGKCQLILILMVIVVITVFESFEGTGFHLFQGCPNLFKTLCVFVFTKQLARLLGSFFNRFIIRETVGVLQQSLRELVTVPQVVCLSMQGLQISFYHNQLFGDVVHIDLLLPQGRG